jgi:ATP synthase protein I
MADRNPPSGSRDDDDARAAASQGWTALGYLISGIVVWGFIGWLVGHWVGTPAIDAGIGVVVGVAGAIYLIVRQLGK